MTKPKLFGTNLVIVLMSILILSCQRSESLKQFDPSDPYLKSFHGKGIRYLKLNYPYGASDSLHFNAAGDLVYKKSYRQTEQWEYDRNHFPVRYLYRSDVSSNYVIEYKRVDNGLIQHWVPLPHSDWNYSASDTIGQHSFSDEMSFSAEGRLIKITGRNGTTSFSYDSDGNLEKKEHVELSEVSTWRYKYDSEGELIIIAFEGAALRSYECHFENGLPKYLQYTGGRKLRVDYEYFY